MSTDTLRPVSDTLLASCAMLGQVEELLSRLDDDAYTRACPTIYNSTIGGHVRHTLDHYRAALATLEGETVDYDHRDRDTAIETTVDAALTEIEALKREVGAIPDAVIEKPTTIQVMLTGDGACTELKTTLARELWFATHHAIHHNAMIRTIAGDHGIETPDGFGKAPSTIDHERDA